METLDVHVEGQEDGASQADAEPIRLMAADCRDLFQICLNRFNNSTESSVASEVAQLVLEYDHRFDAWSSFLGVFASGKACLDHRLRSHPALQDMILRLLDILRRNLYLVTVYELSDTPKSESAVVDESEEHIMTDALPSEFAMAFSGIKESIVRLNKLGIAIRSSSRSTGIARARRFAHQHPDLIRLAEFETRAYLALQHLYPNAPETLRQQLADAMTDRYAKIQYESYRSIPKGTSSSMAPNPGGDPSKEEERQSNPVHHPVSAIPAKGELTEIGQKRRIVTTEIRASSIDTDLLKANLAAVTASIPGSKPPATLTVQTTRPREPPIPRFEDGKYYTTCEWCFQVIDRALIHTRLVDPGQRNYAKWSNEGRRHYRQDLQPYVCISESCAESRPTYASSRDWFYHMMSTHSKYWSRDIHKRKDWVCTVKHEYNSLYKFSTQDELQNHISLQHQTAGSPTKEHDTEHKPSMLTAKDHGEDPPQTSLGKEELAEQPNRKSTAECNRAQDAESLSICPICLFSPRIDPSAKSTPNEEPVEALPLDEVSETARKRIKLSNRSHQRMDEVATTSWLLGSHIAEHLHHLMIISLRMMSVMNPPSDGDYDWSASGTTSGGASEAGNEKQEARFDDLPSELQGPLTWSEDENPSLNPPTGLNMPDALADTLNSSVTKPTVQQFQQHLTYLNQGSLSKEQDLDYFWTKLAAFHELKAVNIDALDSNDVRVPTAGDSDAHTQSTKRESADKIPLASAVSALTTQTKRATFDNIIERPDILDIISCQDDDLEEAITPKIVRTILQRHQRQALSFMQRREQGWNLDSKGVDVWEALDTSHGRVYINRITEVHQNEAPPPFSGGIVADPMGLGKTLVMIALAAADFEASPIMDDVCEDQEERKGCVAATLVIVPQPLLTTWEEQLTEHVLEGTMKYLRHHGKTKLNNICDIDGINVVLTTYHTVSAAWRVWKSTEEHIMFSVRWKRIILDEAHLIRNMKTHMARAVCDLSAISRWAVTGTPIQNRLEDLASLFKFIRAHPYDNPKQFDADICHLWKAGKDEEAVNRLKRLTRCLILRRAKQTINLPRRDVRCPVEFSEAERALYDNIRQQTITRIDNVLLHDTELSRPGAYANSLQQIESMRLVCNLGLHYNTLHDKAPSQDTIYWAGMAQKVFNIQREMGTIICFQCSSILEMTESLRDENLPQDSPQFSRCLKYTCAECSCNLRVHGQKLACGHTPLCPVAPVSISNSAFEEVFGDISKTSKVTQSPQTLPSKVKVLISDLKGLPQDAKSAVFSTWRLTLDIIEAGLNQAGIRSVRFDGKLSQTQRQPVLNEFKSNPNVRVILLTLSCGTVGLTLTEASRAYLMEPHWNPAVEEQALARIHRIGQTRDVTTVRFYIRESFEESVM